MINSILIICIGNICRSPIAEFMFRDKFKELSMQIGVSSAGLGALVNHPADSTGQELSLSAGMDISEHRARQLTNEICLTADLIICMSNDQVKKITESYPSTIGRVYRLGHWEGFDIPDPYRRPRAIFEQSFHLIEKGVNDWFAKFFIVD